MQIKTFKLILCLIILDRLLSCAKGLSDALQATQVDLVRAADLLSATTETIQSFHSDEEWKRYFHIVRMLLSCTTFQSLSVLVHQEDLQRNSMIE